MVGTVLRAARAATLPAVCCALLTGGVLVGGCARVVPGSARAGEPPARVVAPVPIAELLIEPTRFPASYPAVVLPPQDIDRVLGEIDGVPAGSEAAPPECAPLPVLAAERAAAQGTDDDSGTRMIVTVVRPVPSIHARAAQLAECPSLTITSATGDVSTVAVTLPPPPPVDADDSYAVDQTVTSGPGQAVSRTLTFVALVGDVRVTASWQRQASSDAEPDAVALDALFSEAVLRVRRALPR